MVYEHFPRLPFLPAPYEEDGKTFIVLEHLHLDPLLIRFSQESIHRTFQGGRTFERMYDGIAEGNLGIHQVPMIRVFRRSDKLFTTHDNRRLMIFQWLAEAGHLDTVRVEVVSTPIPAWQLNNKSDGLHIKMRKDLKVQFRGAIGVGRHSEKSQRAQLKAATPFARAQRSPQETARTLARSAGHRDLAGVFADQLEMKEASELNTR